MLCKRIAKKLLPLASINELVLPLKFLARSEGLEQHLSIIPP